MPRRLSGPPFGGPTPRCERRNFVTDNVGSVIDHVYVRVPRANEKGAHPWFGRRGERTRVAFCLIVRPVGRSARCQWSPQ